MSVVLVAMAPSGDAVIIQRESEGPYLQFSEGVSGSGPIDGRRVAEAVGMHGFIRLDRVFPDLRALDKAVNELVGQLPQKPMPRPELNVSDVRRFLPRLTDLALNPLTLPDAGLRAARYLEVVGVRSDSDLYAKLIEVVKDALAPATKSVDASESELAFRHDGSIRARWGDVGGVASTPNPEVTAA